MTGPMHILVPGAGGDAFYWHRVAPLLPGAVAIDLPAGQDGAGEFWQASGQIEAMRGLARSRLGLDDVTVVDSGHLPALSRPEELARAILAR